MESTTDWVRAHELEGICNKPPKLFDKIDVSNVLQGKVGDAWLLAGMACAAEFDDCVRAQFINREYDPYGCYKVRIFNPLHKKFQIITVDDRIPCNKGTKKPRFMQSAPKDGSQASPATTAARPALWPLILEKAYAKYFGSYGKLTGNVSSRVAWGLIAMTGDNVFILHNSGPHWKRLDVFPKQDKWNKSAVDLKPREEKYTDDQIWTLMKKYDAQRALLAAAVCTQDGKGPSKEKLKQDGLLPQHTYSIIQARELVEGATLGMGGVKHRLLQLRNPWGGFEWKGDWSDKSALWEQNPGIKATLAPTAEDTGTFWMNFEDFSKVYGQIYVCDRTTTNDLSLNVHEENGSCGVCRGCVQGCCNFWACCAGARTFYGGHVTSTETLDATEKTCLPSCLQPKPASTMTLPETNV